MSVVNKSIEEAIAMRAEYIRNLAQETDFDETKSETDSAKLWGQYEAFCWIEHLLDIDWSKYNSEAVSFTNRIYERGQKSVEKDK